MKKVYVEKGKVVVELEGVKVHYDMHIIEKRINSLLQDLEEWRKYQRLLTPDAADETTGCAHRAPRVVGENLLFCDDCNTTFRR